MTTETPYELVERELGRYKLAPVEGLPPFAGGAVGMFGYDLVRSVEPTVGDGNPDELGTPDMALMVSDVLVAFDHLRHEITILANVFVEEDLDEAYAKAAQAIEDVRERLAQPVPRAHAERREPPSFTSNIGSEGYAAAVERCKEYIRAGDAYQVVPSQRWSADSPVEAFSIYRGLRAINPSPYMYFLDFEDFEIAGASPESLVKVEGRRAEQRPIAGTRPRADTAAGDLERAEELLADEKERAEHVMLVDLARNDLGRVCEYGSVTVDELMVVETYSHVLHIVSSVSGDAARGSDRDGRAAGLPAGGHAERRPEDPRDADHRRAGAREARAVRRLGRLPLLHRRPRHLHLHPLGGGEGRPRARPGGRRHRGRLGGRLRGARDRAQGRRCVQRDRAGLRAGGLGVKVLVVDNYDSFTFNLVQYLGELGAEPEVVRNDSASVDELLGRGAERLIVSPGPCTPAEAGVSTEAIRRFAEAGTPVLGVCLGHQALATAFGGKVVRGDPVHGKTAEVEHDGGTIFEGLPSPLTAGRYHSLIVDPDLPDTLEASAHHGDTVMAIRHRELPAEGVQFHPESVLTGEGMAILRNFLR